MVTGHLGLESGGWVGIQVRCSIATLVEFRRIPNVGYGGTMAYMWDLARFANNERWIH